MTSPAAPWYRVYLQLLPVKIIYFCFMAAVGDLLPFIPIIMKQFGLSPTEMGIIYGVMPFISFFVRPIFGILSDKTNKPKLVLIICIYLTGLFYGLLLVTPTQSQPGGVKLMTTLMCNPQDSFLQDCVPYSNHSNMNEHSSCDSTLSQFADTIILPMNKTDLRCEASCSRKLMMDSTLDVCFLNDAGTFLSHCNTTTKLSNSAESTLTFGINNISLVVSNEVIQNRPKVTDYGNDLTCRNYDLKQISFGGSMFYQMTCREEMELDCTITCDNEPNLDCFQLESFGKTFWVFFAISFFCNIFFSPVISLIDAIAYDILGEKRRQWGQQRLWGTIGFAAFAITSTFIMDAISKSGSGHIDYSISFYIFIALCFISAKVALTLKISDQVKCGNIFANLTILLHHAEATIFLIMMTFFGVLNSVPEVLLFWYLQEMGSSQINLGLCLVCSCTAETIVLFLAGRIIKRIGHMACLYIGLVAYAVRFLAYSFLTNPWHVLPIEVIHSITFGLNYAAASAYASFITPPGMAATMQGLLGGLYFGFGKGIGGLVSGKLYDSNGGLGPIWTFRFYSFFSIFLLLLYITINSIVFRKPFGRKQALQKDTTMEKDIEGQAADSLLAVNQNSPTTEL